MTALTTDNRRNKMLPILTNSTGPAVGCAWSPQDWTLAALFPENRTVVGSASNNWDILCVVMDGATAASFLPIDKFCWPVGLLSAGEPFKVPVRHANVELRVDRLTKVQSAFGVSTTELAEICGVSRAALYKWLAEDQSLHLSPANWSRLHDLGSLAEEWNRASRVAPGELLREPLRNGRSLWTLLTASVLNFSDIHSAFDELSTLISYRRPRRSERLRQAGIQPRPLIRQFQRDE